MVDLNHTTDSLRFVPSATLEDHLANQLQSAGPPVVFDLYPAQPDEPIS